VSNFNNGDFYIDNVNGDFYLRKNNAWVLEGNIRGSGSSSSDPSSPIITGNGPPPTGGQVGASVITGQGAPS
jgi:hypothetical protein